MSQSQELFGSIYERGDIVFRQDDPGDTMYIIQCGAVEVSQRRGKREVILACLERDDFFGEMALIDDQPRSATVTVIRRARLLPLTRTSLLKRVHEDPGVALHLLKVLCNRIKFVDHRLEEMVDANETFRLTLEDSRGTTEQSQSLSEEQCSLPPDAPQRHLAQECDVQHANFWPGKDDCISYKPGEIIFSEGDPGHVMYIIIKGSVQIALGKQKDKCLLARLDANDFFGEMALITTLPRTATAFAITDTRLLPVDRQTFFQQVKRKPGLALYILQVLIMRLRESEEALTRPEASLELLRRSIPLPLKKKGAVKVAIISLSTCGGCTAVLLEQQEMLTKLLEGVEVTCCSMLTDSGDICDADIAIVDGAVRIEEEAENLKEARFRNRYLVAWGTCASFGGIPAMANQFPLEELIEESYGHTLDPFSHYLSGGKSVNRTSYQDKELALLQRAGKLNDFVRVDYYLPGCPPPLDLLAHLIKEIQGDKQVSKSSKIVCAQCNRKPPKIPVKRFRIFPGKTWGANHCFTSRGAFCLGSVTKGGCGAICPRSGLACWGCRGPSEGALKKMSSGDSLEHILLSSFSRRCKLDEAEIRPALRVMRKRGSSVLDFAQNFASGFYRHSKLR
jgi:F420-non-reducing hydrogenase small subunit